MASDLQKYRATSFQVGGFALMSPIGRLILDLQSINYNFDQLFNLYLFISIMLFILGIIFVGIGDLILKESKNK